MRCVAAAKGIAAAMSGNVDSSGGQHGRLYHSLDIEIMNVAVGNSSTVQFHRAAQYSAADYAIHNTGPPCYSCAGKIANAAANCCIGRQTAESPTGMQPSLAPSSALPCLNIQCIAARCRAVPVHTSTLLQQLAVHAPDQPVKNVRRKHHAPQRTHHTPRSAHQPSVLPTQRAHRSPYMCAAFACQ